MIFFGKYKNMYEYQGYFGVFLFYLSIYLKLTMIKKDIVYKNTYKIAWG